MAEASRRAFGIHVNDIELSYLPYAHVFERVSGVMVAITTGSTLWLSRGLDHLAEDLQAARPTILLGVPRVFEKMHRRVHAQMAARSWPARAMFGWSVATGARRAAVERPALLLRAAHAVADRLVLARLRRRLSGGRLLLVVSGGAPLSRQVEEFMWAIGLPVYQGWGLTETTSGATANLPGRRRAGTVGMPLPGVDVRLAPDGEILVRGPGIMAGYHRRPDETAAVLDGSWLATGDLGTIDGDGYLTIVDRKKAMIKTSGGKPVAPQPIEIALASDPVVDTAMVVGEGRPYLTALIVPDWAAMAARERVTGTPATLVRHPDARAIRRTVERVNRTLAPFETIKGFELLVDGFTAEGGELTPTLTLRRSLVEQRYRALIDRMY